MLYSGMGRRGEKFPLADICRHTQERAPHPVAVVHSLFFPFPSYTWIGFVSARTHHVRYAYIVRSPCSCDHAGRERESAPEGRSAIVSLITQRNELHRGCRTAGVAHGTSVRVPRGAARRSGLKSLGLSSYDCTWFSEDRTDRGKTSESSIVIETIRSSRFPL